MSSNSRMSIVDFWRLARQRQNDGHLPALRQAAEALILYLFYGVGPGYYQLSAFWERSTSWHDKTQHLSDAAFRKKLLTLNPPEYRKLSQNKLAEKALFQLLDIPSPEYLGYYHHTAGTTADGAPLTNAETLQNHLNRHPDLEKICFKGIEGWGGNGFEPVRVLRNNGNATLLRLRTNKMLSVSDFCEGILNQGIHATGSIIEQVLTQHDVLSSLNPSSVNTLRVWVLQRCDSGAATILAYLRVGRAEALVDNQSSGGMIVPVNLRTGILDAAMDGTPRRYRYATHPDHGAAIENVQLPFFTAALRLAQKTILAFPNVSFAGADVAITADGPQILELNVCPDRIGAAFTRVPSLSALS